ncbi:TetR/AcrR family transcriptional regulator [Agriterribacter sp.]|uniref:TetR/AcrR family transcriptional regulator n=1 Tax=Agriterribacter sp. TaxID=2821509 RepID=UPI002B6D6FBD|nr:TetR/AcrR family transcriptional regulator [Agriterribacter sp.]HTN09255.1 TetR/AcrR family transcriptional regulator [Agriterribacter sp.]
MTNKNFTNRQIEIMEIATQIIDRQGIQELTTKNLATDIGLSEAALYRHFKSKNEIMLGLLDYFMLEMKERVSAIAAKEGRTPSELLKDIFTSQLKTFAQKPAIVSVIFSEGIFQFNKELMEKVSDMMEMMQVEIDAIIKRGQQEGSFRDFVGPSTVSTIIMGSMRLAVMKWKIFGHQSDLVKEGNKVLNGVLKMVEKTG